MSDDTRRGPDGPGAGGWGPPVAPPGPAPYGGPPPGAAPGASGPTQHGAPAPYGSPQHGAPPPGQASYGAAPQQPGQWGPGPQGPPPGYGPPGHGPAGPPPSDQWPATQIGHGGPPGYGPPPQWGPPGPPPRRRRTGLIITAVAVVAVLIAGAATAWALLGGRGGASSADQAVTLLAADLAGQDYLRAFSRLAPAEAELITDVGDIYRDELVRLEVLRPDAADQGIGEITVNDLGFDPAATEQVRDNVAITALTSGTITIAADPSQLPFTDSFRDLAFPEGLPPATETTTIDIAEIVAEQGEPVRIATVQVDGEWYVSLLHTAADYALRAEGLSWPAASIPARGAASPQDALRETVQAALDADLRRLIELAPPDELSVLHDVGEVLLQNAGPTTPSGARVIELETAETEVRGQTALGLTRVVIAAPNGQQTTVTRQGDCLAVAVPGSTPQQVCSQQLLAQAGSQITDPTLQRLMPRVVRAMLDIKVVTREVDGQHYVSPVRTVVGIYAELLGALTPEDLAELLRSAR